MGKTNLHVHCTFTAAYRSGSVCVTTLSLSLLASHSSLHVSGRTSTGKFKVQIANRGKIPLENNQGMLSNNKKS